ncbi:hypothetical protein [Modestobacter sp. KNN46-3]|jgi:hypothetical protein|uniref:hypothetical protein n=1 Tax=Modestobacter sp. KNN46-3 TaxID=2711218 RepID=UPI0013DEA255|nr:hypothetical protein [Modestobacter sp. KNN46-3]
MNEAEVVAAFCAALRADGWDARTEVDHIDVVATRDGRELYAEAKGTTTSVGLDVDTMYGQLLRRMSQEPVPGRRFAVVVPEKVFTAVSRVPASVRAQLKIDVYVVDEAGRVELRPTPADAAWRPGMQHVDPAYAAAADEWTAGGDEAAWESTVADGLTDAPPPPSGHQRLT